jgi:hypothetical protein
MLTAELTKAGQVSPDILMEVVTARSLTELKRNVNKAIAKQKAENDQLTKLSE